jgi:hypothetical protein
MAAKTTFLAGRVLNQVLKDNAELAYSWPATVYAALFTTNPTVAGLFTGEVPTGAGTTDYARQAITWGTIGAGSSVANSVAITYAVSTAGYGGTPIGWVGICDTVATASGMLYQGPLTTPKTVGAGDQVSFAIGALVVTES